MTTELRTWFDKAGPLPQSLAVLAALFALTLAALLLWRATRALRGRKAADTLTVVAAAMASSVAATGMWHFFSRTMHLPVWLQAVLFAFMEISVLASALRARANVAREGNAGADGLAVWVLTSASGLMSASEAASVQEALVRLGAPLVAAWLWERSMVPERRARRAAKGTAETAVRWLFSVKRVAVRLGLATALGADLETEDANRRIDRFVRADNRAQRAGLLTRRHAARRRDRAHARLMEQARMQADPRALYAHLGRQAILDVLARLGGDDAVIDRERARQMQHILADATREQPRAQAQGPTGAGASSGPQSAAGDAAAPVTGRRRHAGAGGHDAGAATAETTSPLIGESAPVVARQTASQFTARQDELPLRLPEIPTTEPAATTSTDPAANGVAHAHAFHIPAARQAAEPAAHPATTATANGHNASHANGSALIPSAPAEPAAATLPVAAPGRAQIPVEPVRFVAAPLPEPQPEPRYAYDTEPDYEPEYDAYDTAEEPAPAPTAPSPGANIVLDEQLAARITRAIAASENKPNLLKLANELGISIARMQDTIDALGGFNAVWTRTRQDRGADATDPDLTYYPA